MVSTWMSGRSVRAQGLTLAAAGAVAFSGKAIVAKLMYRMGADPVTTVGLRMAMAFPLFAWMAWWSERRQGQGEPLAVPMPWWRVLGLGFSGYYLASTLDFMGLRYISASLERAILYLNPTLVLLLSVCFLGKRLRWAQLGALAVSYSGLLLVWWHDWQSASLLGAAAEGLNPRAAIALGSALVFLSALAYAIYLMGSGQLVQQLGSLRLVGWASCFACVMCLAQWALVHHFTNGAWGRVTGLPVLAWLLSALNATLCTVLPVWLVMHGVQMVGASAASQVGMVGPLSTLWMAAMFLGEPVTGRLLLGTGAVLAGIVWLGRMRSQ
jgi:drug/metabolite transporter (DMT)-like permease